MYKNICQILNSMCLFYAMQEIVIFLLLSNKMGTLRKKTTWRSLAFRLFKTVAPSVTRLFFFQTNLCENDTIWIIGWLKSFSNCGLSSMISSRSIQSAWIIQSKWRGMINYMIVYFNRQEGSCGKLKMLYLNKNLYISVIL